MVRKLTHDEFLTKAKEQWGDRWNYSETKILGTGKKTTIICPQHGPFEQVVSSHLRGRVGCAICVDPTKDPNYFFTRAVEVWGYRWDYGKTIYEGHSSSIIITCKEHGDFTQRAIRHLDGQVGCPRCSGKEITTQDFIQKLIEVWGDRWDYSQVTYVTQKDAVILVCLEHGPFQQVAAKARQGIVGCSKCNGRSKTTEEFILEAQQVWGDRWDYGQIDYVNTSTPIQIRCREHGPFEQNPSKHLIGRVGCSQCNGRLTDEQLLERVRDVWGTQWDYSGFTVNEDKITVQCREHGLFTQSKYPMLQGVVGCYRCRGEVTTTEEFIDKASKLFGSRWNYTKAVYKGYKVKVILTCPQHGDYQQTPECLFRGKVGCKGCQPKGTSKGEKELGDYVQSLGFDVRMNVRGVLDTNQELDVYLPQQRVAFEFNGVYWHSERYVEKDYHYQKYLSARRAGILLYQVWEDDWNLRKEIVRKHIREALGVSDLPKVPARKTKVRTVPVAEARLFLDKNHIQGFVSSSVYLGLQHDQELVALATFKQQGKDYILTRYATSAKVQGGHSKLVTHFERNYTYSQLITFADLTFGQGNLYRTTGWVEDILLPPDYSYVVNGAREHKFGYRLKRFKEDPDLTFEEGMTERELAQLNGLHRVYDAGKIRYVKPHPDTVPPILD